MRPPLTLPAANGQPAAERATPTKRPAAELQPLLLSAADLAELLSVSVATVWRLRAAGKLPRPSTALGKQLVRWDAAEIRRWVSSGCPALKEWNFIR
jgi:predicted DNA-binding transcriptional regulator AlpA